MILKNILLAFQLENYKNTRFLKFIYSHPKFWFFGSQRQPLVWTSKAKLLFILSVSIIILLCTGIVVFINSILVSSSLLVCLLLLLPYIYVFSNIVIQPLDAYIKKRIIQRAKEKLSRLKNIKVIAITGSYGKTSTREILTTLLSEKYTVVSPDGNKNTPLGVSDTIMKKLDEKTEIFIVEMGAYEKGDIRELCNLVHPNISILTGITLQHLERFGSIENIQDAKFEILESLDEKNLGIIDISGKHTEDAWKKKKNVLKVKEVIVLEKEKDYSYLENFNGLSFTLEGKNYTTKLIAPHSINTIKIAIECAKKLGLTQEQIDSGIAKIGYIQHRMEVIKTPRGVTIIDDSYNGNLQGVASLIELLEKTPFNGRKIIVAGGIVELGEKLEQINQKIGEDFAKVANIVLIAKGPVGDSIVKGLILAGFEEKNIKIYDSALDIHKDLANVLQTGDVVVFQNDLPDTYL